jgi:hypothetical protein
MFAVARSSCFALVMGRFGVYFKRALGAAQLCADNGWLPTLPMPVDSEDSAKEPCLLFSKHQIPSEVASTR